MSRHNDLSNAVNLPRLADHMLMEQADPTPAARSPFDQWDSAMLPIEIVETTKGLVCTVWLNKISVQNVEVNCTRRTLNIRVTSSTQPPNFVTYEREIELPAAIENKATEVLFNSGIATITMLKAQPGAVWRLFENTVTVFTRKPQPTTPVLHVETR